jgi:hypothetical protein
VPTRGILSRQRRRRDPPDDTAWPQNLGAFGCQVKNVKELLFLNAQAWFCDGVCLIDTPIRRMTSKWQNGHTAPFLKSGLGVIASRIFAVVEDCRAGALLCKFR